MKKKLLLADDEEHLRLLVYTTLEDPGLEILEAADGETALEMARTHQPDLLVLDWMMPGLTGIEVARILRAEAATRQTPIVMLTAKGMESDLNAGREAGVTAYLIKPFSPVDLLELIQTLLA